MIFTKESINYLFSKSHTAYNINDFYLKRKPLIVIGLSGSGKSTIGKKLAVTNNALYIEEDEVKREFDGEYNTKDFMNFPKEELQDLFFSKINSTIRIKKETNKYSVGKVYLIRSYEGKTLKSVRIKVTKVEKGPLKEWVKYCGKNTINQIIKGNNITENEPSEFIHFDIVYFSISKTLSKVLDPKKYFVFEGIRIPMLYNKRPDLIKKIINPKDYAFLILNTSLITSSYRASIRGRDFDSGFIDRLNQNSRIIKYMNKFKDYLDSFNMTRSSFSRTL